MTTPMQGRMEAALANLEEQRMRIRELEKLMSSTTGTAHSKNRMVTVTVDKGGRLTEFKLEGTAYRTIAPAELSSIVVETVQRAQADAAEQAMTAAAKLMPDAFTLLGMGSTSAGDASGNTGIKGVKDEKPAAPKIDIDAMFAAAMDLIAAPVFQDQPAAAGNAGTR